MLIVGAPVKRDDGRFYIPLSRDPEVPEITGRSSIVARVASDAFTSLDSAIAFANALADVWNEMMS